MKNHLCIYTYQQLKFKFKFSTKKKKKEKKLFIIHHTKLLLSNILIVFATNFK